MISSQDAQMVQENPGSVSLEIMTLRKKGIFSPDDEDKEQSACESVGSVKEIKS